MAKPAYLPGVFIDKQDGGLAIYTTNSAPRVLVLGTAADGQSERVYLVGRTQDAYNEFGTSGTLVRGMYEVKQAGGQNVILFRMGATSATLTGIGVDSGTGISIETADKDDDMGTTYEVWWDNDEHRLVVSEAATGTVVYDRDFDNPTPDTDTGDVYVEGTYTEGEGTDIGTASAMLTFVQADDVANITYTAGTDGTTPSRMKLYENLFISYKLLENEQFDYVVPMDVYLDDNNVADGDTYAASPSTTYPTVGSSDDILLYFYAEEYQGEWYFWWRKTKNSGAAEIYPAGHETTTPSGVVITSTIFNEVNFAYQLANFCFENSRDNHECHGVIGVKAFSSLSLKDVSTWIGTEPTYTIAADGSTTVASAADDGTGLLGNKFMAGKYGFRSNKSYGGFIATEEGYLDGTEDTDDGGWYIDIGKYISVCAQWITVYNSYDDTGLGYTTTMAPTYAGFITTLDSKDAPTNKILANVSLPYRVNKANLDSLVEMRYIVCTTKAKGNVIVDAPTAARPDSDYARFTTVRIVKDTIDAIRQVLDPFIGRAWSAVERAAADTAIEGALQKLKKGGYLTRYEFSLSQTTAQKIAGEATLDLVLTPAFEVRRITVKVSLKSS